jgi:hypothetical protein
MTCVKFVFVCHQIRTRLFGGVISGAEISSWLMKYYCSDLVVAALEVRTIVGVLW